MWGFDPGRLREGALCHVAAFLRLRKQREKEAGDFV